jgi:hypothetical protein
MQISNSSSNYWLQQLQQELTASFASAASALQQLPATGQNAQTQSSAATTSTTTAASSAATASAGSTTGAGLLGNDALNWLISSEQSAPSALANDIIQAVNPGGDSISLQQVATTLGQSTSSLSSAFSALDPDGTGTISQSQLTTDLTNLLDGGQGTSSDTAGTVGGHHHHHHHTESQSSTDPTDSSSSASTDASTSTSTTASTTTGSTTSTDSTTSTTPTTTATAGG